MAQVTASDQVTAEIVATWVRNMYIQALLRTVPKCVTMPAIQWAYGGVLERARGWYHRLLIPHVSGSLVQCSESL